MSHPDLSTFKAGLARLPATRMLAAFAAGLRWEHLDADAVKQAERHFLDTLGAIIAGAVQPVSDIVADTLSANSGADQAPITVPGRGGQALNLLAATHLAGTAAHGMEVDDGYRVGMMHPGSVVVPTALLLGSRLGASGRQVLTAMAAGYEIACRLSAAIHPRARWRGFHPTPAVGVFASAATAGSLLGLDARQMEHAYGIAASSSAGLFTFMSGGDVKRLHAGLGAREGLFAALLAQRGLIGPPDAIESRNGFLYSHAGGDLPEHSYEGVDILASGGPAGEFSVTHCYTKPYACCRHIHSPIDALLDLRERHGLTLENVDSIHVGTYAVAAAHGETGWSEMTTAQMSIPFVLATALDTGDLSLSQFERAAREDQRRTGFCPRVSTTVDAECEARYPATRPARLTVKLKDGRQLEAAVDDPLGSVTNRLDDTRLQAKFSALVDPVLGERAGRALLTPLRELRQSDNVAEVLALASVSPD